MNFDDLGSYLKMGVTVADTAMTLKSKNDESELDTAIKNRRIATEKASAYFPPSGGR